MRGGYAKQWEKALFTMRENRKFSKPLFCWHRQVHISSYIVHIWEEPVRMWKGWKSGIFTLYTLGFLEHLHFLLWWKLPCVLSIMRLVMFCHLIADTKAQLSDFKLLEKLFQFLKYGIFKNVQQKFHFFFNLIAEWMQRHFDHIFAYYDSPLPNGSDEIIKNL